MESSTGLFFAPEQSFAEETPSTNINQSGCRVNNASLASSAAEAHEDQGIVPQIPRGSFRKSAPMTNGLEMKGAMIVIQCAIQEEVVCRILHMGPYWEFFQLESQRLRPSHQCALVMWLLGMTMRPALVRDWMHALKTSRARGPVAALASGDDSDDAFLRKSSP